MSAGGPTTDAERTDRSSTVPDTAGVDDVVRLDPLWTSVLRAIGSHPAAGLAVVLAVAVAAMVAASAPLFESSVGNEVFRQQLAASDRIEAGLTVTIREGEPRARALAEMDAAVTAALPVGDHLDEPVLTMHGRAVPFETRIFPVDPADAAAEQQRLAAADPPPWEEGRRAVQLFARPGATDHLDVVWASGGPGLWVPDTVADELGIVPGDGVLYTAAMSAEERAVIRLEVAGVYRDLWEGGLSAYWQEVPALALPRPPSQVVAENQRRVLLIGEPDDVVDAAAELGEVLQYTWQLAVSDVGTLSGGRELSDAYRRFEDALVVPNTPLRDAWEDASLDGRTPTTSSALPDVIAAADQGRRSIGGLLRSLSIAGVALSLAVIAVTGAFVTRRRAGQVRLLWSQGVGPWAHGLRSAVELIGPALVGAALGWAAALLAIGAQGPWSELEPVWLLQAARSALLTAAVGLVTLLVVAAASARAVATDDLADARRVRLLGLAVLVVATAASGIAIGSGRIGDASGPLVQAFPLLAIALAGSLTTVALAFVLQRWGGSIRTIWADLALQRLRTSALSAAPLVMATAVAIGLVVYATALASSTSVSAREKALAQVGSTSAVTVLERYADVDAVPDGMHLVSRARTTGTRADGSATLLVVDAAALADRPTWREGFADVDLVAVLRELVALGDQPGNTSVPVVAAGPGARQVGETVALEGQSYSVVGEVVRRVEALPGMGREGPTYLADRAGFAQPADGETDDAALSQQLRQFRSVLWGSMDESAAVRAAVSADLDPRESDSIERRLADPRLLAQIAATDFVRLLGGIATLVAIGALALYGGARQRERTLSYALSRRMGLSTGEHQRSLLAELILLLVLAALAGLPAALLGLVVVLPALDPLPGIGPSMTMTVPVVGLVTVSVSLLVIGVGYALLLQRRAETADVAEVLRVSD